MDPGTFELAKHPTHLASPSAVHGLLRPASGKISLPMADGGINRYGRGS
jgi:hypothetical protein